jgi:hypothetical protein
MIIFSRNRILAPEVHIIRSGRQMLTMETYLFPKRSKKGNAYLSLPLTTKAEHTFLPLMKKSSTYPCLLQIVFVALKDSNMTINPSEGRPKFIAPNPLLCRESIGQRHNNATQRRDPCWFIYRGQEEMMQ